MRARRFRARAPPPGPERISTPVDRRVALTLWEKFKNKRATISGLFTGSESLPSKFFQFTAVLAFARLNRWIVEGPEGGHGLSPLGVKEIGG